MDAQYGPDVVSRSYGRWTVLGRIQDQTAKLGAGQHPERRFPSMFEPVHGSAPDIAGQGIANPIGAIWSASLLLDHCGYPDDAAIVMQAVEEVVGEGEVCTPDLGGSATTSDVGKAVAARTGAILRRDSAR